MAPGGQEIPDSLIPIGLTAATVDGSGRIKLPADIQRFLDCFPNREVFVTTYDRETLHVYPIAVWLENERVFAAQPEETEEIRFVAYGQGAKTSVDPQGRLVIPQETRRVVEAGAGTTYKIGYRRGCLDMIPEAAAKERLEQMIPVALEKRKRLGNMGLV